MKTKVAFLDRDGVLNKPKHHPSGDERNYITSWSEFEWIPGSKEAIVRLLENDYFIVVVSNQACIGKFIMRPFDAHQIMYNMHYDIELLRPQEQMQKEWHFRYMICPHTAKDGCFCRKPKPGMIVAAGVEFEISQPDAWMVGDHRKDILAGWNAGIRKLIRIDNQKASYPTMRNQCRGVRIPNLLHAVNYILETDGIDTGDHLDVISCPECQHVQVATVEHTAPFCTMMHECTECEYMILESEWNSAI